MRTPSRAGRSVVASAQVTWGALALGAASALAGVACAAPPEEASPPSPCRRCLVGACAEPVRQCEASRPCLALDGCLGGCEGDARCVDACFEAAAAPAREGIEALARCTLAACASPCGLAAPPRNTVWPPLAPPR